MREVNFKHTEIGLIPHDWEVKTLGEYAYIFNGDRSDRYPKDSEISRSGIPFVNAGHIVNGRLDFSNMDYISIEKYNSMSGVKFMVNDILVCLRGSLGKNAKIDFEGGTVASSLCVIRPYAINPNYLSSIFNSSFFDGFIKEENNGSSQPNLSAQSLLGFKCPLPPTLAEQERIAGALSSIDTLIGALNEQIEKKRHIKQGTMQQLLTGKKRLAGFTGEWKNVRLGEIGVTYSGLSGKSAGDFGKGQAQYITFLNILNNPIIDTSIFERVQVRPNERQNAVHIGDLFFNTSSETPEEVGICAVILEEIENLYLNSFCFGYRLIDVTIDGKYLAYYFRSKEGRELMTTLAQGATRYNLSKSSFCKAEITIPPTISEQSAIAAVLSGMDTEIAALEQKRDKYIAIKSGMMQDLLTGKIRLV